MLERLLAQMVTVEKVFTVDQTDFLSGTQLDQPGIPGVYVVHAATTDDSGEITINQGSRTVVSSAALVRRDNAEIHEDEDVFYLTQSPSGGRPVISIDIAASQTGRCRVKFIPAMEI